MSCMVRKLNRPRKLSMNDFIKVFRDNNTPGVAAYYDPQRRGIAVGGLCGKFDEAATFAGAIITQFAKQFNVPAEQAAIMALSAAKSCKLMKKYTEALNDE